MADVDNSRANTAEDGDREEAILNEREVDDWPVGWSGHGKTGAVRMTVERVEEASPRDDLDDLIAERGEAFAALVASERERLALEEEFGRHFDERGEFTGDDEGAALDCLVRIYRHRGTPLDAEGLIAARDFLRESVLLRTEPHVWVVGRSLGGWSTARDTPHNGLLVTEMVAFDIKGIYHSKEDAEVACLTLRDFYGPIRTDVPMGDTRHRWPHLRYPLIDAMRAAEREREEEEARIVDQVDAAIGVATVAIPRALYDDLIRQIAENGAGGR